MSWSTARRRTCPGSSRSCSVSPAASCSRASPAMRRSSGCRMARTPTARCNRRPIGKSFSIPWQAGFPEWSGKFAPTPGEVKATPALGLLPAPSSCPLASLDLILQGRELLAAGRARDALRCAEEALACEPRDAEAMFLLGAAHYRDGDLAAAERRLKQAIQADAKVALFHSTLGNVYQDRGALNEAVAAYRRALGLKPDLAAVRNDLGTAYFAQGHPSRAAASYQRATELQPDHAVAFANLGAVYRKLGMPREARHALQRELVLRLRHFFRLKKRHRSLAELAHEELRLGNPGLALRIGRRALEQDANNPVVVALLAAALREDGSVEEAIGCAKRAVDLRPADARSRERLGSLLLEAGSPQSALPHLEQWARL